MSVAAQSDFTCTTIAMQSEPRERRISGSPRSGQHEVAETHAAWANEELESSIAEDDAWSCQGLGVPTPGQTARGDVSKNQDNGGTKEDGTGSDPQSPDMKLHNSKSDRGVNAKKIKYLSRTPNSQTEERIHSNTSLLSRDKTTLGQAPTVRWEASQGALSRHNTTFSLNTDGKHSNKNHQNGTRHWEGSKQGDGNASQGGMNRQKTIMNNAHAPGDQQCANHVMGFSRSKTVVSIPSRGLQAKELKRDPTHLSATMTVSRISSVSDMDLSKKPSRTHAQPENETQRNIDPNLLKTAPRAASPPSGPKMEYKVPKAMLPKTGLIKLTALNDEKTNPALYDEYLKDKEANAPVKGTAATKTLGMGQVNVKFVGRKVKPVPLSHKRLMNKQKELLEHRQEGERKDWKTDLNQNTRGFTFEDLQRGILSFDMPGQGRKKPVADHDENLVSQEEAGDKAAQLPPLEIPTPRDGVLPPIRT